MAVSVKKEQLGTRQISKARQRRGPKEENTMQYLLLPSSMLRSLARSPRRLAPYLEPSLTRCYATDTNGPNQAIVEMLTRSEHHLNFFDPRISTYIAL